jgi:hypothetical protein
MMVVQLPLWITALPALSVEDGTPDCDRLWIPSVYTFYTFALIGILLAFPFITAWEVLTRRR